MRAFRDFIDEYLEKHPDKDGVKDGVVDNRLYVFVRTIIGIVLNEVEQENPYRDEIWYRAYRHEIQSLIKQAVVATVWVTEEGRKSLEEPKT